MAFETNSTSTFSEDLLGKTSYNTFKKNPVHITVHLIYFLLGFTLNTITIITIVRGRFGKKMKIQLINLAVADLLSSFCIIGGTPVKEFNTLPYPNSLILCKTHCFIAYSVFYASLLCNAAIATERFIAVYFPFLMARYKKCHAALLTASIWVVAFAGNFNIILAADLFDNPLAENRKICFVGPDRTSSPGFLVLDTTKFILPSIIVLSLYIAIIKRLRSREFVGEGKLPNSQAVNSKVTKMLAADGLISVAIWLPYYILAVVNTIQLHAGMELGFTNDVIKCVFYEIFHANCFLTPVIYFTFNREFKREGKTVLCSNG